MEAKLKKVRLSVNLSWTESHYGSLLNQINWPELLVHTRDHFHTHNPPRRAHHEDEARGSISELPDDNWIQLHTALWHDSGLHTLREPHISVLPPRRCSKDGSDRKRNKRHQPAHCRYHGDRRKTKNHWCANNRWQRKTLKPKSRNRTNTFKTEDNLDSSSKRTALKLIDDGTKRCIMLGRVPWVGAIFPKLLRFSFLGFLF